jgi:hypothetical protein
MIGNKPMISGHTRQAQQIEMPICSPALIAEVELGIKCRCSRIPNRLYDGLSRRAGEAPGLTPVGPVVRGEFLGAVEMPLGDLWLAAAQQVDAKLKARHRFHIAGGGRSLPLLESGFIRQEPTRRAVRDPVADGVEVRLVSRRPTSDGVPP